MTLIASEQSNEAVDVFSRLMQEGHVFVRSNFCHEDASEIIAQLLYLFSKKKDITLYVMSSGGMVSGGLAVYDVMQSLIKKGATISTVVVGEAFSMAAIIAAGGSPGYRTIMPSARVMLHQPGGAIEGRADDVETAVQDLCRVREKITEILCLHTKKLPEEVRDACSRDNFMDAKAAVKFGLADKVSSEETE